MKALRAAAARQGVPVLVDPKVRHFDLYRGATVVTPNQSEAEQAAGTRIRGEDDLRATGEKILRRLDCGAALVTRGEHGMSLFARDAKPLHIPTAAREVFDVTGAGDSVVATLALALATRRGAARGSRAREPRGRHRGRQARHRHREPRGAAAGDRGRAPGVKVAVVGAGPAGTLLAWKLASRGASVTVFDASHPREKPCGGGLTPRRSPCCRRRPRTTRCPRAASTAASSSPGRASASTSTSTRPVAIASRTDLDGWLLRRATAAGAVHVAERVIEVDADGGLRTAERAGSFDLVVGADGAGSLVRRTFVGPTPPARLTMAAGWFATGASEMTVRFPPGLAGLPLALPAPRPRRRRHLRAARRAADARPARPPAPRGRALVPGARGRGGRDLRAHDPVALDRRRARCARSRASAGRSSATPPRSPIP